MVLGWNPRSPASSNKEMSSSPRTPSSFSLLKSTLGLSTKRSGCGICHQTVRSGQGTAIFTAECSHTFHFPCIAAHVKPHHFLVCPLCNTVWKDLPLLPLTKHTSQALKINSLRVYNDDEPLLLSPTRFNPIPESNEEDEFQGFPTSPKSNSEIAVHLLPEAAVLAVGRGYETYALTIRVKGPPAGGGSRRDPVDLVTVLDVSETMKLHTLKRAMRLLISSLSESDRLSIVVFSASSNRLLPLRRMTMTGRRTARRVVDALGSAGQGMCVSDALKKAAKVLEDRRHQNSVATIILFTGAHNDRGPTISSTRFSNIPVHAITITDGHALPDDTMGMCLGTRVVQDLRLQLGSGSGQAHIAAVYSVASKQAVYGSGLVRVGDLLAGEEREFLVELRVPSSSVGSQQFLSVRSSYKDPSSGLVVHTEEQALTVPRPHAVRSTSQSITRLRNLHVTVRAIAESRRLIEHDDMSGAHRLLASARALLQKGSTGSSEEFVRGLEAEQAELQRRRLQKEVEAVVEPLTPTSAWRAAERLAKVAIMRKSMNRVSDLYGFEDARF